MTQEIDATQDPQLVTDLAASKLVNTNVIFGLLMEMLLEEPQIPNFGKPGTGPKIEVGNVFAIEPIVNAGKKDVWFDDDGDGYSVFTVDGSRTAHFEHTVVITEKGPEIVTIE